MSRRGNEGNARRAPRRGFRTAAAALLAAVLLCACLPVEPPADRSYASSRTASRGEPPASSAPSSQPASREDAPGKQPAPPVQGADHSSYGRSTLPAAGQAAYDALARGFLNREEKITLSLPDEQALTDALLCVRRDYPVLSWLDSRYTYELDADTTITSIYPRYTKTGEQIAAERKRIEEAAAPLIENIDPGLSDFDRALIVYDRLCGRVTYDLNAPNQRELFGALCDARATCDGYAKAYQYLLSRIGIEALTVYGESEEPHAWNIVRLDGAYYQADPTWGDAMLTDGGVFLSHAYLFLDDEAFAPSHTPYGGEHNYPLPACTSMEDNYFVRTGTELRDAGELSKTLRAALDRAMAQGYDAVQLRFSSAELWEACRESIDSGEADRLMQAEAARRGKTAIGRSAFEDVQVLTYLIE